MKALLLRALDILANKSREKKNDVPFFGYCFVSLQVLKKEVRQCFSVKQSSMRLCAVFDFYYLNTLPSSILLTSHGYQVRVFPFIFHVTSFRPCWCTENNKTAALLVCRSNPGLFSVVNTFFLLKWIKRVIILVIETLYSDSQLNCAFSLFLPPNELD